MPVYQPVQFPFASLNSAFRFFAFGEMYGTRRPCLPSGSWNSLDPPTKMSAWGLFFSAVMRVWRSPAAASGRTSTCTPVAVVKALNSSLFVDSFSAE